jgi:23S rRNA (uridine2552-2'-O)-methyltransferase
VNMTKKRVSKKKEWQDHYSRQAKKENYPARSVYKLQEIHKKYKLLRPGQRVLDLGCAPGSWLLFAAKQVGEKGQVVGVDLLPVSGKLPSQAEVHVGDVFDITDSFWEKEGDRFHLIMSDMAPSTTGNRTVDAARSFNLCEKALGIAKVHLLPGGSFVCKIFQGEDFQQFVRAVRDVFQQHKIFKPQSCRKSSKEIYVIGLNRKQED